MKLLDSSYIHGHNVGMRVNKTATVLRAEGQAKAFELIQKSFVGNAQKLKQLETLQSCLEKNSKVVITEKGISPTLIMDAIQIRPADER